MWIGSASKSAIEQKLNWYQHEINALTHRIAEHRKTAHMESYDTAEAPCGMRMNRKKRNEWRRVSIALHHKRSELKIARERLETHLHKQHFGANRNPVNAADRSGRTSLPDLSGSCAGIRCESCHEANAI